MKTRRVLTSLITALLVLGSGFTLRAMAQSPTDGHLRLWYADKQALVLELTVDDFQVETVEHAGQTYHRLIVPGMVQTESPGEPQVPVYGTLVGVSSASGVSVQVLDADFETLRGYCLYPAPALVVTADSLDNPLAEIAQPSFALDQDIYAADAFYPGAPVKIGYTGYLRDQPVAQVQFYPAQYNPVAGEIHLYRRILVRVTWDAPLSLATTEEPKGSPVYEHLLRDMVLNYDTLERPAGMDAPSPSFPALTQVRVASNTTNTLKIGVTGDGLYLLTPSNLTGAGFDLSGVDPRTFKISNRGTEVPIYVPGENDGTFDPGDTILFYGTAITDIYTTENVYWLTAGGSNGQRMSMRDGTPAGGTVPVHFPITLHAEEDTYYWQTMPNGAGQDHWFWGTKLTAPASQDYTLTLNHVSTTATTATVRVRLKGRTDTSTNPDHHTRIYLNGAQIDDQRWDGQISYDHQAIVSHALLNEGSNTVTVEGVGDTGASVDQIFVNWIEIAYWDTYVAENDALFFGAPGAGTFQFEVTGFSTNTVQVFDITDPSEVVIITNTTILADGSGYKLRFEDTAQAETRYLALTTARRKAPASIALDQPSSWKSASNGADYVIITHQDFYTSSLRLASYRAITSSLRVATVKVADVYDEFNYGIFNPQAIRDFLSYAYHNWVSPAPTYVLLVGDAYQDYKDNLGTGTLNYVPSQIIETDLLGETPSDNWFVLVSGADVLPDMLIGRLSAQQASQVDDIVDKIIHYEQHPPASSWNTKVLLVADDDETSFEITSEQLAARLPYYYTANKVYAGDYPPGNPTTDISNSINAGNILVNYTGHGSVDSWGTWSGGNIFVPSNVTALANTHKLPFVTAANCLNGFFTGAQTQVSMAEECLRLKDRGAVAVWAPTGLGYPAGHRLLMQELYDAIFQDDQYALGAATTAAKIAAYNQNNSWGELVQTFILFGDPATSLGLPTNYPYVESTTPVNGARDVPVNQQLQVVFHKPMSPSTVLLGGPGTAGLVFTPTWSAGNTVLNYAHTSFSYNQTLTFTISGQDRLGNPLGPGPVPSTWSFKTPVAPGNVSVSGLTMGIIRASYTFAAAVSPGTVTQPITYTWQATEQPPVTHAGRGLNDTGVFNWNTPGTKTITVTATNVAGSAARTHTMTIYVPPSRVTIAGPTTVALNASYTFNATVSPITTTQPITYVWQATDKAPLTHAGGGVNDTVNFNWNTPGTKTITVIATNAGGTATGTHLVTVKVPPAGVGLAGPATGVVQVDYTFTASVSPITATAPFTYVWQASEQLPVIHRGSLPNDTVTFNWETPGAKTITITATNNVGTASITHGVVLTYSPPTVVWIAGPTKAAVNTAYTFNATVSPITATRPITYVWQATGQSPVTHTGGGLNDAVTFTWPTTGTQTITVTATNAGGTATQTHQVTIVSTSVDVAGPTTGVVQVDHVFNATLNPSTAAQPVTYTWQATGQPPVTHAGRGLNDSATFNWNAPGAKTINITATNAEGTLTNIYTVTISYAPPTRVDIAGPLTGTINTAQAFTAAVSPLTATLPITYVWQATGQPLVTHTGGGLNDAVAFTWVTTGTQAITATATNAGGAIQNTHFMIIEDVSEHVVYLPLVLRNH